MQPKPFTSRNLLSTRIFASFIIAMLVLAALPISSALAAATPANNPGTGADDAATGTITWASPGNITTAGSPYATASLSTGSTITTHYLKGTNYGFNVPEDATINGIQVSINRNGTTGSSGGIRDVRVSLVKGGTVETTNKANTASDWPTSFTAAAYGGAADLWGSTWTPAEVNAANFGVVLSARNTSNLASRIATVDYMQITITYTLPSTGAVNAGTGTNVAGVGTVAWSNPGNVISDNNVYATAALNNTTSNYLQATNYGFSIPSTSTINGIRVAIGRFQNMTGSNNDVRDVEVKLIKGGTITATNKAATTTEWPTSEGVATYGSDTDQWGNTWSPEEINATDFGVALSANSFNNRTASVDYIQITVSYTQILPTTTTTVDCGSGTPVVTYGSGITCVATVTRSAGINTPGGNVTWTSSGTGTFATSPCVLSGSSGTASCSVNYTPGAVGTGSHLITANYLGNYQFQASSGTQTVTVNTKALTMTGLTANNKIYDGSNTATLSGTPALVGIVGSDSVTVSGPPASIFNDKTVANSKPVTVTGYTLGGTAAANYALTQPTGLTANITPKALTGIITVESKAYDGTTAATIATYSVSGEISGEDVNLSGGTANFNNKNVGPGKTVTATGLGLSGTDAGNYTVNTTATSYADITTLAITGNVTVSNKIYDGTTSATIATRSLSGHVVTDNVSYIGGTATFGNKNVANGITVTATGLGLSGTDAGNYTVNDTATTTANITPKALTGNITASDRVYNANANASIASRTLTGVISPDVVIYEGGTAIFDNKNVGTGKTVTGTLLVLSGANAGNYTVNSTATTTANITPFTITGSITASHKVYDGAADATIATRNLGGVLGTDDVTYTGGVAVFNNKNVGNNKPVAATGLGLSGADAGNYTANTTANTTANITVKGLTVTADDKASRVGADPEFTYSVSGLVSPDNFVTAPTCSVSVAHAIAGTYPIACSGGNAGSNYTISYVDGTLTVSNKEILTVTADDLTITYGDADPTTYTFAYSGFIDGDDKLVLDTEPTCSATGPFTHVGSPHAITCSGGTDNKYEFSYNNGNLTVNKLAVTVTANAQGKTYGSADPELTYLVAPALVSGDSFSGVLARDAGENIGDYAITQGSLSLNANYDLSFTSANLTITPLAVTVTADAQGKLYGADDPELTYSVAPPLVSGDSFSGTLLRDIGETVGDYDIQKGSLALSSNYILNFTSAKLTIGQRPITVTADAKSKTIGTSDPALTYQITTGALYFTDTFSGALARDPGEVVGSYAITQGDLALNTNYNLVFIGANLTITAALPVTITGKAGIAAATLSYNDGGPKTVTADGSGNYTITIPSGWTGTVTPTKTGYFFTPANRNYATPITANQTIQNYVAGRKITYYSQAASDGWVLESSETSNKGGTFNATQKTFQIGDDNANRQYKAILSFNTAGIPANASIKSVVIQIKQSGTPVGSNPFIVLGGLLVDVRKGTLGTAALQATDFQAYANALKAGTFNKTPVDSWYTVYLGTTGRANVNRTGITQFRLYFAKDDDNNAADPDYIKFFSSNNSTYKPKLIITYTLP